MVMRRSTMHVRRWSSRGQVSRADRVTRDAKTRRAWPADVVYVTSSRVKSGSAGKHASSGTRRQWTPPV